MVSPEILSHLDDLFQNTTENLINDQKQGGSAAAQVAQFFLG